MHFVLRSSIICYRFANPGEASGGLEAWRLGGSEVYEMRRNEERWQGRIEGMDEGNEEGRGKREEGRKGGTGGKGMEETRTSGKYRRRRTGKGEGIGGKKSGDPMFYPPFLEHR